MANLVCSVDAVMDVYRAAVGSPRSPAHSAVPAMSWSAEANDTMSMVSGEETMTTMMPHASAVLAQARTVDASVRQESRSPTMRAPAAAARARDRGPTITEQKSAYVQGALELCCAQRPTAIHTHECDAVELAPESGVSDSDKSACFTTSGSAMGPPLHDVPPRSTTGVSATASATGGGTALTGSSVGGASGVLGASSVVACTAAE
mmetsp:Transcript_14981/g.38653  ORF Transcript_14981/g.38653 Transcript_14981/m.38653 type:complete len:206 (-) Transcript_14981:2-619(-)